MTITRLALAKLLATDSAITPQSCFLFDQPCTIGRMVDNTVHIDKRNVSRYHAEIYFAAEHFWLLDRASRNGTFVNDYKIEPNQPYRLNNNDSIGFGTNRRLLVFMCDNATTEIEAQTEYTLLFEEQQLQFYLNQTPVPIRAGTMKFKLLKHLYDQRGRICSLEACVRAYQAPDYRYQPSLDHPNLHTHMSQLRMLLADIYPGEIIVTYPNLGYKLL
ncbi:FHA domain-containing protein [Herpetosiphon geysericola]|uniref:FHA domain-containing protein n=1 Tax=Herpetosiphon geysericola TaxID=70996 RepID=UPI0006C9079C|nr:FHA domain-containing protein [Herpetosiphon geysericola]